ncbi:HsdS specificity protein of type I restriction-modification system [Streptococcus varani]|uniref:HsdS specificity protein of type I restriction-modification system n=1 Tax=Streptococcus varani TaxID=1608583 RepID=A0A0E4H7A3_9STRE|nr:restriction endonuclease subunit S [Streptococcus varani]CQR24368.1 HsdS specificity protein of type I restriction-modification system [Streptococcus varani]
MSKNNIPKVRFVGFEDEWETIRLGDVSPLRGGFAFKSEKFTGTGIPIVRISNVQSDGSVGGDFAYHDELINDRNFVLLGKSILVAMSGATTGKISILDSSNKYYQNQRVGYFVDNDRIDYTFLSSILRSKYFSNQLKSVLIAGAQPNISSKEIDNFKFRITKNRCEQSQIGSLFSTIDSLLSSYKDNLENYQSFKKSMLSKMFPKAGQTIPEIRLDGFEGEWELIKMGKIFTQQVEYIEPDENNELWSLTVEKGLTPKTDRYKRDFLVKKTDKFKRVKPNDFAYNPMNLTLGSLDANQLGKSISVSGYYVVMSIEDQSKYDIDYFKILLKTSFAIFQYKQYATGSLIEKQRVQFPTFSEIPFAIPTVDEQRAIGSFFSNLDDLISSYQTKIDSLETLKKKLLQDMFI